MSIAVAQHANSYCYFNRLFSDNQKVVKGHNCSWLVVWLPFFIFPISWECHPPNWRTHIFSGWGGWTTNQVVKGDPEWSFSWDEFCTVLRPGCPMILTMIGLRLFGERTVLWFIFLACFWGVHDFQTGLKRCSLLFPKDLNWFHIVVIHPFYHDFWCPMVS